MANATQIVVNWHVTEACNYRCKFCYSHWDRERAPELWRNAADSIALIEELRGLLSPGNPLWQGRFNSRPRLSLAGGEPTLWQHHLSRVVDAAAAAGFEVSLISNGSRPAALRSVAPRLTLLGLSVDATRPDGNARIGRVDRNGEQISASGLVELVGQLRMENPCLKIKVNTVVNAANADEDFSTLIAAIAPERWKILRMLPSYNNALEIDGPTFRRFVNRHKGVGPALSVEDNHDMVGSYLMVDPLGRFFQNRPDGKNYNYSTSILEVGAERAFAQIPFALERFLDRYAPSGGVA